MGLSDSAYSCATRWRTWFLMRYIDARMLFQDWQGFQLHKIYVVDLVERSKHNVTFLKSALDTDLPDNTILEFRYSFRDARYRIQFGRGDTLAFPPYDVEDVPRTMRAGVLMAVAGKTDVTTVVKEYAGPLGDFHEGVLGHRISAKSMWFKGGDEKPRVDVLTTQFKRETL